MQVAVRKATERCRREAAGNLGAIFRSRLSDKRVRSTSFAGSKRKTPGAVAGCFVNSMRSEETRCVSGRSGG
jgi:hypothetical protein